MELTPESCYSALLSRDARFDGRFFVAVTSTGIYCRPICRVKTPKAANSLFFPTAAAAEQAGFRPCLKCRPEIAPGYAPVDSGQNLAHAARELMDKGLLDHRDQEYLAARLGIGSRYLRRIFRHEFGVSPIAYIQSRRLLLAKQLLTDTQLPMAEVALAAGFNSVQRFNASFREHYRLSPSAFRRAGAHCGDSDAFRLELAYRPPYAWHHLLDYLAPRILPGVESVADDSYRRLVSFSDSRGVTHSGWLTIQHRPQYQRLRVTLAHRLLPALGPLRNRLGHFLDLNQSPGEVQAALGDLPGWPPGLRIPGCLDGFEAGVRAIAGQQISVGAAIRWLGRFVDRFGTAAATPFADLDRTFPAPALIAGQAPERIAELGINRQRAGAIIALARACRDDPALLEPGLDAERQIRHMLTIPGIGDWTARYIALRALSYTDAFPAADAGVLAALTRLHGRRIDARQALALSRPWQPWRGYMTLYLWHLNTSHKGEQG
ncbi:MAG: helix-turn-helix domain-containing protein [Bacteroidales bacterium]|nr:helix-turn-helix domain-containing protein [Bacteroidales bacterium]